MGNSDELMEKAGSAISPVLRESKLLARYKLYQVKQDWPVIMGEKIAKYSYLKEITKGVVTIAVTNPVWMNHLFLCKEELIKKINTYCKETIVKDMRFVKSGKKPVQRTYEMADGSQTMIDRVGSVKNIVLPTETVHKIRKETADLPDNLREKLRQLRYSQEKLKIAYLAAGYVPCPDCGRWIKKEETICFFCRAKRRETEKQKVYQVLMEAPWCSFEEIKEMYPCEETIYNETRRDCIYRLIEKIYHNADSKEDDFFLALFITRQKPTDLTEKHIENIANKYRRKTDVSSYRRESDD